MKKLCKKDYLLKQAFYRLTIWVSRQHTVILTQTNKCNQKRFSCSEKNICIYNVNKQIPKQIIKYDQRHKNIHILLL